MRDAIKECMSRLGIEYFAVLNYGDCRESAPGIMRRAGFLPRSVIVYLLPYYVGETVNISRYAASLDYHLAIAEVNAALSEAIHTAAPDAMTQGYGDHSPIDERHAALIAGLGVAGDNGLIINDRYGSYVFIGDLVTDLPPDTLGAITPRPIARCEGCGACRAACPTGILRGESEACLSAITQRKGELTAPEIAMMREYNTAWGCDLCQTSCPHNAAPRVTPIEFFHRENILCLTRDILDAMTDDEFARRAYAWRKRPTVERNLDLLETK